MYSPKPKCSNGKGNESYLEVVSAERDRLRALLQRVYLEAYNPAAHEKPAVQDLWREVGSELGVFVEAKPSRF